MITVLLFFFFFFFNGAVVTVLLSCVYIHTYYIILLTYMSCMYLYWLTWKLWISWQLSGEKSLIFICSFALPPASLPFPRVQSTHTFHYPVSKGPLADVGLSGPVHGCVRAHCDWRLPESCLLGIPSSSSISSPTLITLPQSISQFSVILTWCVQFCNHQMLVSAGFTILPVFFRQAQLYFVGLSCRFFSCTFLAEAGIKSHTCCIGGRCFTIMLWTAS